MNRLSISFGTAVLLWFYFSPEMFAQTQVAADQRLDALQQRVEKPDYQVMLIQRLDRIKRLPSVERYAFIRFVSGADMVGIPEVILVAKIRTGKILIAQSYGFHLDAVFVTRDALTEAGLAEHVDWLWSMDKGQDLIEWAASEGVSHNTWCVAIIETMDPAGRLATSRVMHSSADPTRSNDGAAIRAVRLLHALRRASSYSFVEREVSEPAK